MATRTRSSGEPLRQAVRAALAAEEDVLAAYLFGSVARGAEGPLSDVDVAVLLDNDASAERHLELIALLAPVAGSRRVDVLVLNEAPPAVAYRALRDGIVLVVRDERARVRHWVRTVDRYLDMAPARRILERGSRRRLAGDRFGRP